MRHFDVALAFIAGRSAKNDRMSTDGSSIMADGYCLAVKLADGLVVLATTTSRSGSIMRSAIRQAVAATAARYATVYNAQLSHLPKSPDALSLEWANEVDWRTKMNLKPLIFNNGGQ